MAMDICTHVARRVAVNLLGCIFCMQVFPATTDLEVSIVPVGLCSSSQEMVSMCGFCRGSLHSGDINPLFLIGDAFEACV